MPRSTKNLETKLGSVGDPGGNIQNYNKYKIQWQTCGVAERKTTENTVTKRK
jgi:hypothetical protein